MQKLLTAAFLLAGCTLHQASAQRAHLPHKTPQRKAIDAKPDYSSPTWVPNWVSAEFCEAYSRYFPDLPYLYKYNASQALRDTPLADPEVNLTSTLAHDITLRETVYKTIYQHCYRVKYGYGSSRGIDELVYLMLYNDFHLSNIAATELAMHISSRYKRPAPQSQSGSDLEGTSEPAVEQIDPTPASSHQPNQAGLELPGWHLDSIPMVLIIDMKYFTIRFKIRIDVTGGVASVTKVTSNASPAQEKLCREALLNAHFSKTKAKSASIGFYTYKIESESNH